MERHWLPIGLAAALIMDALTVFTAVHGGLCNVCDGITFGILGYCIGLFLLLI
jgi:hypothetical protein